MNERERKDWSSMATPGLIFGNYPFKAITLYRPANIGRCSCVATTAYARPQMYRLP